jgi:hypothetical protein
MLDNLALRETIFEDVRKKQGFLAMLLDKFIRIWRREERPGRASVAWGTGISRSDTRFLITMFLIIDREAVFSILYTGKNLKRISSTA